MVEAEDKHASKRAEILKASMDTSNTPMWGYFGMTGPLAIGDNSYAPKLTKKPASEDGGELLRNVVTNPCKKGSATDVYFRFETYISQGDVYQDPGKAFKKGKVKWVDPEAVFRPPGAIRRGANKLGYEYEPHCDTAKDPKAIKEKYKDYVPPRQIMTNPTKKGGGGVLTGGVLFGWGEDRKFPEHVPDDFESAKKIRLKELEEHKKKLQDAPFKGIDYGNRFFGTNADTFHCDLPSHVPRDIPKDSGVGRYPHESPFRPSNPSKKGALKGCMGTFPEWVQDPEPKTQRKVKAEDGPPPFKNGVPAKAYNPMPSVVTNMRNMRNERPASFARPVF